MTLAKKLSGKKALVTGAGTGIGREIALEFARQGADVALHYSRSDTGAKSAVDEILSAGGRAAAFHADFSDIDQVQALGHAALQFLGGLDCLVNNAGITFNKPFLKVTREQFDRMYQVNIRAQFFLTQCAVEQMEKTGGGARLNIPCMPAPRAPLSPIRAPWRSSWRTRTSVSMPSRRAGSPWRIIIMCFPDSILRMPGKTRGTMYPWDTTGCPWILPGLRCSCVRRTRDTL